MKIGRLLIAISVLMLLLQPAGAQVTLEKLRNSPEQMTGLFHPYPASPDADTPAPAGFKPFYISHYRRHFRKPGYTGPLVLQKAARSRSAYS